MLLDLEGGEFFVSRGTGPRVWELLTSGSTLDEAVDTVVSHYKMDRATVASDVEIFVATAIEKGFLLEDSTQ